MQDKSLIYETPAILTSAKVGMEMSEIEVAARRGEVWAQDLLEKQAQAVATVTMRIARGNSLSRAQALKELQ